MLDIRDGDGFRVIVMEDVGADALHKHPDAEWYRAAVREIAKVHRQSRLFGLLGEGLCSSLKTLVPAYDDAKWVEVVREGLEGTLRRFEDGTYTVVGGLSGDSDDSGGRLLQPGIHGVLKGLAEKTLAMLADSGGHSRFSPVFIHGDYHDGNILIRAAKSGEEDVPSRPSPFAIVDWGSARWDSGFFDLVSLCDVGERMGTFHLSPHEIIRTYLHEMSCVMLPYAPCTSALMPSESQSNAAQGEWRRCRILRAWDELRWFSETGEDFGDR